MTVFYSPSDGDTCKVEYQFKDNGSTVNFSVDMQNNRWGIAWYHHEMEFDTEYKLLTEFTQSQTHVMGVVHFNQYGVPLDGEIQLIAKRIRFAMETGNWDGFEPTAV